jgi:hypothetical protein
MTRTEIPPSLNGRPLPASNPAKAQARPDGAPWSMRDAASYWGVSERHVAGLAAAGKVRTIKIGSRRMVPDAEVRRVAEQGA